MDTYILDTSGNQPQPHEAKAKGRKKDMSTYETRKARSEAANRAFYAFMDAYADAIGEKPAIDDPETKAARRLAAEAFGFFTAYPATDDDRATVSAMVEAIADRARAEEPEPERTAYAYADAAEAYADAAEYAEAHGVAAEARLFATYAAEAAADARKSAAYARRHYFSDYRTSGYASAAVLLESEQVKRAEEAAARAEEAAQRAEADAAADPEDLEEPAPLYQRAELLAYLGDPDAYDVDAIEAEATRYTADGARVWVAFGEDLAAIAERHELYTYAPAI